MKPEFIPLEFTPIPEADMIQRAKDFYNLLKRRRTVRDFSGKSVPREIIENALLSAGTAPNGVNQQPWHFVVVSNPEIKKKIREAAEEEERAFYKQRAPEEWLDALAPLGTDEHKPFFRNSPVSHSDFCTGARCERRRHEGKTLLCE